MDSAAWAVIASPVSALIGVLGGLTGYWLAGRNDAARDERAARREERARRDAFAERLEEDRHHFQRDTLLELQDEFQRLARSTALSMSQDRRSISEQGQTVPDGDRKAALSVLSRQSAQMATAYQELTELIGEHLRRELDRRYLAAAPGGDQGASS